MFMLENNPEKEHLNAFVIPKVFLSSFSNELWMVGINILIYSLGRYLLEFPVTLKTKQKLPSADCYEWRRHSECSSHKYLLFQLFNLHIVVLFCASQHVYGELLNHK